MFHDVPRAPARVNKTSASPLVSMPPDNWTGYHFLNRYPFSGFAGATSTSLRSTSRLSGSASKAPHATFSTQNWWAEHLLDAITRIPTPASDHFHSRSERRAYGAAASHSIASHSIASHSIASRSMWSLQALSLRLYLALLRTKRFRRAQSKPPLRRPLNIRAIRAAPGTPPWGQSPNKPPTLPQESWPPSI